MMDAAALRAPPMRIDWRMGLLALFLYVALLVETAPASLLAWALGGITEAAVVLENPRGNLWSGSAEAVVVVGPSGQAQRYQRWHWEVMSRNLLRGELLVRVQLAGQELRGSGRIALRRNTVRVSEAAFELSASTLAAYLPALALGTPSGVFSLRTEDFSYAPANMIGSATIIWRNAASALSSVNPLGDYVAHVSGAGQQADIRVETLAGALRVAGSGRWSATKGLTFDGTARAAPEQRASLEELLRLLGADHAEGTHRIRISGAPS